LSGLAHSEAAGERYLKSSVPAGSSGDWVVEKITLPPRASGAADDSRPDCFKFRAGEYTALRRGQVTYMTDLYDEWWTQRRAIEEAVVRGGSILVTGLGLGLVVEEILRRGGDRVRCVTVVENSSEVIELTASTLRDRFGSAVDIVHGDAFRWTPPNGAHFSTCWHDVWPDPEAPGVLEEVRRLEQRYAPYCDWQGSWPRDYVSALEREA